MELKEYFHQRYQGRESFLENVIFPIFGEENFDDGYDEPLLDNNHELQKMATSTGVASICRIGTIDIDFNPINIFDIHVSNHIQLGRNRVGVQQLVRRIMSTYSSAFMIFHYDDADVWDWRFTFCSKRGNNDEVTDNKRYTFLLGPGQSCRTAAENFTKLINKHGDIELKDIESAFDVEALSNEFFEKYKQHYERFVEFITGKRFVKQSGKWVEKMQHEPHPVMYPAFGSDDKCVRDYVKKLLGRIVFLHFLQKKGWLGVPANGKWGEGDKQFMKHLFEHASEEQKADYLDAVLEPLFAEGLDKPCDGCLYDTKVALPYGSVVKVPYLNGGLFERDTLDEIGTRFPADYFAALLEFLYQYNFTIDENDPNDAEVGVDPEMLGRIFENLLEDNKDKGAYYTPKEIVRYMCRESLVAYLTTQSINSGNTNLRQDVEKAIRQLLMTPEEIVPKMTEKHKSQFGDALRNVRICDPAIGSGAFPMGLLSELVRLRVSIDAWAKDAAGNLLVDDYAALKREIVCDNIYGVDIERGAIDIARLRFWLSIVVDEHEPRPLPNLNYKFMQGNSLITTFAGEYVNLDTKGQKHVNVQKMHKEKEHLFELKKQYFSASGDRKHQLDIDIKNSILQLISLQLDYEMRTWYSSHAELTLGFDDDSNSLTYSKMKKELPADKLRLIEIGSAIRQRLADTSIPLHERAQTDIQFFDWRIMFTEVFSRPSGCNGFDIVIGNPPYLRIQGLREVNQDFADLLSNQYQSATGSFDFYVCFVEQALALINSNGIANFIMPVKWSNGAFGKGLRGMLANQRAASKIINFGAYQVFNASTYTALQWFKFGSEELLYNELDHDLPSNRDLGNYLSLLRDCSFSAIPADTLSSSTWTLTQASNNAILEKLKKQPRTIGDVFVKIFQGLATGKDDVFFLYNAKYEGNVVRAFSKELGCEIEIERNITKPLLKGEDVHRYDKITADKIVLLPYVKGNLISEEVFQSLYPKAYSYIKESEQTLRAREKGRFNKDGEWYQLSRKQGMGAESIPKLVAPEISFGGNYAFDENGEFYSSTTIYGYIKNEGVKASYLSLMSILNSKVLWYYLTNTGNVLRGGYFRFKTNYVKPFPMPSDNAILLHETEIERLANSILAAKRENPVADTSVQEHEIDKIVYQLYGLTDDEIKIIEQQ